MVGLNKLMIPLTKLASKIISSDSPLLTTYCPGICVLRWMLRRLKSRWRPSLRWKRSDVRYSYDAHSYSQNFDDGSLNDLVSPLAPRPFDSSNPK